MDDSIKEILDGLKNKEHVDEDMEDDFCEDDTYTMDIEDEDDTYTEESRELERHKFDDGQIIYYDEEVIALKNSGVGMGRLPDKWNLPFVKRSDDGTVVPVEEGDASFEKGRVLLNEIQKRKSSHLHMYQHIPMKCRGLDCPYGGCELYKKYVKNNEPCINEMSEIITYSDSFMKALKIDMKDPKFIADIVLVKELVTCMIHLQRVDAWLAVTNSIENDCIGVDKNGDIVEVKTVNKGHDLRDMLLNKIMKLETELNLTRKARDDDSGMSDEAWDSIYKKLKDYENKGTIIMGNKERKK